MYLDKLLDFTKLLHKFQSVIRTIYVTGQDRNENDLEHVGQLALVAWYIAETQELKLDLQKLFKYALAHDLVETYAGDTYFHTTNKALKENKQERESLAAKRIEQEFPEFPELHKIIQRYEQKPDRESRFIYALDKIMPVINIYLDKGRSWQRDGVNMQMVHTKDEKVAVAPELLGLWAELIEKLELQPDLFPKDLP